MRKYYNDEGTIAAISTPFGKGAISVVRMSGNDSFRIAAEISSIGEKISAAGSRRAIHCYICDGENRIDEVLLFKYPAPNSYTGEDMVEINCHGGIYITARILELLVEKGARPAGPGEFTKRAFLNGKIDLVQAEAVQELVGARSQGAGTAALKNLDGMASSEIRELKGELTDMLAEMAVAIDYPEYGAETAAGGGYEGRLRSVYKRLQRLAGTYRKGSIYQNGFRIVITGKPNVGKSTFLNTFIGKNRAIVTDIPGTTRDTIDETLEIDGVPVILTDTAGLRDTRNVIEKIGQDRTRGAIKDAHMVILMLDPDEGLRTEDEEVLVMSRGKHVIIVLNKIDKVSERKLTELERSITHSHVVRTSLINGSGVAEIEDIIKSGISIDGITDTGEAVICSVRQKDLLEQAAKTTYECADEIEKGIPADIVETKVREAAGKLGELLGEDIDEDIIDKIFTRFCLGK